MRELDEALMDRTTASQNRKHKFIHINTGSRSVSNQDATLKSESYKTLSFKEEAIVQSRPENLNNKVTSNKCKPNEIETNSNASSKQKRASKRLGKADHKAAMVEEKLCLNSNSDVQSDQKSEVSEIKQTKRRPEVDNLHEEN